MTLGDIRPMLKPPVTSFQIHAYAQILDKILRHLNCATAVGTYSCGFRNIHSQTPSRIFRKDRFIATYVDSFGGVQIDI
jgi:hypothetical protein